MKTQPLKILMLSAALAGGLVSCKDKEEYPKEISFTEYSLEGTSCQWKNLNYDESVIIINSTEELEGYIDYSDGTYPEIDFSKNTLLLASGTYGPNQANVTAFFQNSATAYTLETAVLLTSMIHVISEWDIAVIVPKISNKTNITLIIKYGKL